ncbi:MAG: hypothetical protein DID89_2727547376 [Candidatus Nitrotoga sp. CP45]|nr:MAG: hypothetical protein DID89_2727547376 [Candidatus Nitrotoga sp. CP45]
MKVCKQFWSREAILRNQFQPSWYFYKLDIYEDWKRESPYKYEHPLAAFAVMDG